MSWSAMKATPRLLNGGGCKTEVITRPHAFLPHVCPNRQRGAELSRWVLFFFTLRIDKMRKNAVERLPARAVVKYGY